MVNINEYKKRFFILLESEIGDVKPLTDDTDNVDTETVISAIENGDFEYLNNLPVDTNLAKEVLQILSTEEPDLKEKLIDYAKNQSSEISESINKKSLLGYLTAFLLGVGTGSYGTYKLMKPSEYETRGAASVDIPSTSSFEESQEIVKEIEKGYQSQRADRGNYIGKELIGTNHGVTAPTLKKWLGRRPTKEEMKNLDYGTAKKILHKYYWEPNNLSSIRNQSIANLIYDGAINQGNGAMNTVVAKALENIGVDGNKGGNSKYHVSDYQIKMINQNISEELFNEIKKERDKRYKNTKGRGTYGKGWSNRLRPFTYSP